MEFKILFHSILLILLIESIECLRKFVRPSKAKPQIDIMSWLEGGDYEWKNGNELDGIDYNSTVFFVPNDVVALVLNCQANYPVQFNFEALSPDVKADESYYWAYSSNSIRSYRIAPNMNNPSSFKFGVIFMIYGKASYVTGNYICQGVTDMNAMNNINVFWEGNAPPYFLNPGSTKKVTTIDSNGKVVLPCLLAVPKDEIDLNLLRQMNVTKENNKTSLEFVDITNSPGTSITYDAFRGFTINLNTSANDTGEGTYRCITQEIDDFVQVEVISDPIQKSPPFKEILKGKAMAGFDEKSSTLTCCSNSNEPPKLLLATCSDPTSCDISLRYLEVLDLGQRTDYYSTHNGNCSTYRIYRYGQSAIQWKCTGDGIDIIRRIIFPIEKYSNGTYVPEVYSEWDKIIPEKLMQVYPIYQQYPYFDLFNPYSWQHYEGMPLEGNFYAGQNITFQCTTSPYYFALGTKMTVRSNNSGDTLIKGVAEFDPEKFVRSWVFYQSTFISQGSVVLDSSMNAVICHAPVQNSANWITKSFNLQVRNPVLPSIKGDVEESMFWTVNSTEIQELKCEITQGDPSPTLHFMRQGKVLVDDTILNFKPTNTSITLSFTHAAYNVHGDYLCVASNFAGNYTKTFHVYIDEPHPWTETIIIIVIVIVLASVIGFVLWKIKSQRSTVSELRRRISVTGTHLDD